MNEEVRIAQGDIEKTIAVQKKTIKVLEQFKEKMDNEFLKKLEAQRHVFDIDRMYDEIQGFKVEVNTMKEAVVKQENVILVLQKKIQDEQNKSEEIKSKLSKEIKILYFLVAGSFVFLVIQFFLMMRFI